MIPKYFKLFSFCDMSKFYSQDNFAFHINRIMFQSFLLSVDNVAKELKLTLINDN